MQLVLAFPVPWKPSWSLWVGDSTVGQCLWVLDTFRPGPQIFFSFPPFRRLPGFRQKTSSDEPDHQFPSVLGGR